MNIRRIILEEYDRQKDKPFVWGETDCFRTACAFAERIIGRDPGAEIPQYDSETSAKRIMLERGWRDMGDVADSLFDEVPPSLAKCGDWAVVQQELVGGYERQGSGFDPGAVGYELQGRQTFESVCGLGVVLGWQVLIRSRTGMGFVPLTHANSAFRVY